MEEHDNRIIPKQELHHIAEGFPLSCVKEEADTKLFPREELHENRKKTCHYKKQSPTVARTKIRNHYYDVPAIRQKTRRMKHGKKMNARRRRRIISAVEKALLVMLCDISASARAPITNDVITKNAKRCLVTLKPQYATLSKFSKHWLGLFKSRFGIGRIGNRSLKHFGYGLETVYDTQEKLVQDICDTGLDSTYLLISVTLCHNYKPNNCNHTRLDAMTVLLCVNAAGTNMMHPLVIGESEAEENEIVSKLRYIQTNSISGGFVHWLLEAEQHIPKPALLLIGPESFIPCLPLEVPGMKLRKMTKKAIPVLNKVIEKITFLFKTSYRHLQVKDKFMSNKVSKCLEWIRDAWWGLPGGALHGYWHQAPGLILPPHECHLPHETEELCSAIEAVALRRLSSGLADTQVEPLHILNIENNLPEKERISFQEISIALKLYDQIFQTVQVSSNETSFPTSDIKESFSNVDNKNMQQKHDNIDLEEALPPVTTECALKSVDTVIRYLSKFPTQRKLYQNAVGIWNFIDLQHQKMNCTNQ